MASLFGLLAGILFATALLLGSQALRRLPLTSVYAWGQVGAIGILVTAIMALRAPFVPDSLPGAAALLASGFVSTGMGRLLSLSGAFRLGVAKSGTIQASLYPTTAAILAIWLLDQPLTLARVGGIATILAGLYVALLLPTIGGSRLAAQPARATSWTAVLFPVGAGACYGIADGLRAFGVERVSVPVTAALTVATAGAIVGAVMTVWRMSHHRGSNHPAPLPTESGPRAPKTVSILSGAATSLAILSVLAGLRIGDVAQVSPVSAMMPLWLVLMSSLLAHERRRITVNLLLGAIVVCAGAAWIGTT